ncbi:MAG: glycosyltransferase family 4 protein, partial [Clostridia bacterium]|nr:glycosyltransferase family 4 protein [Clostridia bacterium]
LKNSISGMQNAANKLQWAIVDGLKSQENVKVEILNSLYIGSYPKKYKKARIPSFDFSVLGDEGGKNVGFLNLPIVKFASKYFTLKKELKKWLKNNKGEEKVIIAYAMTSPFVELLDYAKKKCPDVKCLLFVPDLPEYMDVTNKSSIYNIVKKRHVSHLKNNLNRVDGYVFLTDFMKEWFEKEVSYTVVEGIYRENQEAAYSPEAKEKVVFYAGGLCEEYGVMDLVDAFLKSKTDDWKLEIVGDGPLLSRLQQLASEDDSLIVRGILPNSEVLKRQKEVSLLVNPRNAEQEFTKYSFPSKTIEYMASGTSMLGYKLPGIPKEYHSHLYEITQEDGMESCLSRVMMLSDEEREEFGSSAKEFIEKEKNSNKQCAKIMELLESIK